jgi:Plasmid encoded RepA protein
VTLWRSTLRREPSSESRSVTKQLTPAQEKLLEASAVIFGERATVKDAAFITRQLVQATLPHKNPGNIPAWTRTNGSTTLAIQPGFNIKTGKSYGYPHGSVPRLLIYWMTTEALRTKNPRLELGTSLTGFMAELGLNPDNGSLGAKRSDARRLRDQMDRLFNSIVSFHGEVEEGGRHGEARMNMTVARKSLFWWNPRHPEQGTLWGSYVELSQDFFDALCAAPVPVDMRALRALKRSPLALDLYAWLTYEAYRARRTHAPRFENWTQMHAHMGGDYKNPDDFRRKAKLALRKIKVVYPGLKLGDRQGGIEVLPRSLTALTPRDMTVDGTWTSL